MVYVYGCVVVSRPRCFTTYTEMRFFWLLLSTMNYNGEPFTHIYEWNRHSPSSISLGSIIWILVVAIVALGSTLIICFLFSFFLSTSNLELKHVYDSEAFNLTTSHCIGWHWLVLWVEILCSWHQLMVSLFFFVVLLFSYDFDMLS